jgi:hypothetical protein
MLVLIVAALGISFTCDVLYIGLMRWLLRKTAGASVSSHVFYGVLAIFVCILIILLLSVAPILLGVVIIRHYHPNPRSLVGSAAIAGLFGFVLNSVSLLICGLALVFSCIVILHRLLWPLLQRPLYIFQRYGVIKRKKLLWAFGFALLLLTPPQWSWHWLIETVSKLVSGA